MVSLSELNDMLKVRAEGARRTAGADSNNTPWPQHGTA